MLYFLILLGGFLPLIFGANLLVDSASSLARRYNVPDLVIGLTIVAFGTSAPELVVNLLSAVNGNTDLALGNVVGSNIFNIAAILGMSALIYPLAVKTSTTWIEIPLTLLSALLLFFVANDILIEKSEGSIIGRIDGIVLLCFFLIFLVYNIQVSRQGANNEELPQRKYSAPKSILLIFGGLALLMVGGRMIVFSAVELAGRFGMSERVIGLTIVSIGTSLPELATSVVAARKRNTDIAVGNIVGSNIFNAFFILGLTAVVSPVSVRQASQPDLLVNIFLSLLLFVFVFTGKGRCVHRWEGAAFVLIYIGYLAWLISA